MNSIAGKYFDEISQDTGRYCFGVNDTLKALDMGAVEILIVWENLEVTRYVIRDHSTDGMYGFMAYCVPLTAIDMSPSIQIHQLLEEQILVIEQLGGISLFQRIRIHPFIPALACI